MIKTTPAPADFAEQIAKLELAENFDVVVEKARGGIEAVTILAKYLDIPLEVMRVDYRDDNNRVARKAVAVLEDDQLDIAGKSVLLVDDFYRSGATLTKAQELLADAKIVKTFVVRDHNHHADYHLVNTNGFLFPWSF